MLSKVALGVDVVRRSCSHMVVGGGVFWESSPFPIGAEASPSLWCQVGEEMVQFWVLGVIGGDGKRCRRRYWQQSHCRVFS